MFQLNSRIPLRCFSSTERVSQSTRESVSNQVESAHPKTRAHDSCVGSRPRLLGPQQPNRYEMKTSTGLQTSGAIASSKVTRSICRLPLAALHPSTIGFQPWRPVAVLWYGTRMKRQHTTTPGDSLHQMPILLNNPQPSNDSRLGLRKSNRKCCESTSMLDHRPQGHLHGSPSLAFPGGPNRSIRWRR